MPLSFIKAGIGLLVISQNLPVRLKNENIFINIDSKYIIAIIIVRKKE